MKLLATCWFSLCAIGCASRVEPLRPRSATDPLVRAIDAGTGTNAYVVMGERPILVDTGWGNRTERVEKGLAALGIQLTDLSLIVLTHGHGDHAGGARILREKSGARIVVGKGDVEMLAAGHNRPLRPMGFLGRVLRSTSDKPFPAFVPDIALDHDFDLRPFGVDGKIVLAPGHTPGSLVVVLGNGQALVGDMLRGGAVASHTPTRHLFHDDCRAAEAHIAPIVQAGAKTLWVGHGGPLDGAEAAAALHGQDCN